MKQLDKDGEIVKTVEIGPGTSKNPAYNGFYSEGLEQDIAIVLEKAE